MGPPLGGTDRKIAADTTQMLKYVCLKHLQASKQKHSRLLSGARQSGPQSAIINVTRRTQQVLRDNYRRPYAAQT